MGSLNRRSTGNCDRLSAIYVITPGWTSGMPMLADLPGRCPVGVQNGELVVLSVSFHHHDGRLRLYCRAVDPKAISVSKTPEFASTSTLLFAPESDPHGYAHLRTSRRSAKTSSIALGLATLIACPRADVGVTTRSGLANLVVCRQRA